MGVAAVDTRTTQGMPTVGATCLLSCAMKSLLRFICCSASQKVSCRLPFALCVTDRQPHSFEQRISELFMEGQTNEFVVPLNVTSFLFV